MKNKKLNKIFSYIFFLVFFIVFSFLFWKDYFLFHESKNKIIDENQIIKEKVEDFSLEDIRELSDWEIYYTPYLDLKSKIIDNINSAKSRVYVEVYMFSEKNIRNAIINAKKRWVDVKIVLEKNPYLAYNINNEAYNLFKENDIEVVWSDPKNYFLNHSKFMIIDDMFIVSTWNLSHSTFAYNRDFFIFSKDGVILNKILKIFDYDFYWIVWQEYDSNLILSPNYSRKKLEKSFLWARESINMYFQYFLDDDLVDVLSIKASSGVLIKVVLPDTAIESSPKQIKKLENSWVEISFLKKPKIHSKIVIVDNSYMFLWSINFSPTSIDENRELGLFFKNKDLIEKVNLVFEKDFSDNASK